ncbi:hypothetical protein F5Y01DRAFT_329324 [Xylaria sp. FL0043]|nr:hypothetical protein F5Y01DRAFT_329324 [Xylaria sp. FL0043]
MHSELYGRRPSVPSARSVRVRRRTVFSDIDAVIYNGANVSHLESYLTLKRANLESTTELEAASAAEPPAGGINGYKASKPGLGANAFLNAFLNALTSRRALQLKAVLVSENLWGWLDLVDVRRTSNDVVQKVVDNKPRSATGDVSYVHQTGDMANPIDEMKEFFEAESGHTVTFENTTRAEYRAWRITQYENNIL